MARILIVEPDDAVREAAERALREGGHHADGARSGLEAASRLEDAAVVVASMESEGVDVLSLLRSASEREPSPPFVLLAAADGEKAAREAMRSGGFDYALKPIDADELRWKVDRALEAARLRAQNRRLQAEASLGRRLVAESEAMKRLLEAVDRVADREVTVLVRGEAGTGKDLLASLIHARSRRSGAPLVCFRCASIPPDAADTELFGPQRGGRPGFLDQAKGGTLVLDEVAALPPGVQPKLAKALCDGDPISGNMARAIDVRVVATTRRDLGAEIGRGGFDADLGYRLSVVELTVPPLRQRPDDIAPLAHEAAAAYAARFGLPHLSLSTELVARLVAASWPGNVRQLEHTIARMVARSEGGVLGPEAFDESEADGLGQANHALGLPLNEQVEALERNVILHTLAASGGNQSEAARRLGMSRATLFDRLKRYRTP